MLQIVCNVTAYKGPFEKEEIELSRDKFSLE